MDSIIHFLNPKTNKVFAYMLILPQNMVYQELTEPLPEIM